MEFSYFHDPNLCKKNKILNTYIESLHVGGFICYELIRQSNYLRDDDYVPSVVSFSTSDKNEENMLEEILELEHAISNELSSFKSFFHNFTLFFKKIIYIFFIKIV